MIHYHGGPATPYLVAIKLWMGRHAFVSYARYDQIEIAADVCQTFALDNGAYSAWKKGTQYDFEGYADWVAEWRQHPGFDFAIIPDTIDGTEEENDWLIGAWLSDVGDKFGNAPVWYLHESLDRLDRLVDEWPRVALGSSGQYSQPGNAAWWKRMDQAMKVACDSQGRPRTRLHGLRMLNPTVFSHLPLSSADSTSVARNTGLDKRWASGAYPVMSQEVRAAVLISRIEAHASAPRYIGTKGVKRNPELIG